MSMLTELSAVAIVRHIREGSLTAEAVTSTALERIALLEPVLNCFTAVLADEAIAAAREIDRDAAAGKLLGPLAGVPFSVKNLFDVENLTTLAGSKLLRGNPPARSDAVLVKRLKTAGAVLVGANTMDEFAYGFTTENAHDGPCRNPHDPSNVAGGSSGGSAAAVAAGMVPLSLGSDTNGSIRVPSSFCGVFGLKPTYGRLPRTGSYPFVHSLDHLGPFARNVADLALSYDLMQSYDPGDPACADRPKDEASPQLTASVSPLRIAVLEGWFREGATTEMLAALETVAAALGAKARVALPEAKRARAAAFCLTASEGANLHLEHLKTKAEDFDPATRDRFLAGALLPATIVQQAQRFRRWFQSRVAEVFQDYDILLAPATPGFAPAIGQVTMRLGDLEVPVRPNIGIFTQPISFIGLPVVAVPVVHKEGLPLGVQIIAPPWHEARALRVAAFLEKQGVVSAPVAKGMLA